MGKMINQLNSILNLSIVQSVYNTGDQTVNDYYFY